MATGDQADFLSRLRTALPLRWFPGQASVLDGLLSGMAAAWAIIWQNLQFIIAQTRINTASGEWLDAISNDFFAGRLSRYAEEADSIFRTRIIAELLRVRATRGGLAAALAIVTDGTPNLFEFCNVRDTGAWGAGSSFYYGTPGAAVAVQAGGQGGWGSQSRQFQAMAMIPRVTNGPGLSVSEVCATVADVSPCCGIVWLNAFASGETSYFSRAEFSADTWTIDNWNP